MTDPRDLTPAEHVAPAPDGGWSASDVEGGELVDDQFIAADPDSYVIEAHGSVLPHLAMTGDHDHDGA